MGIHVEFAVVWPQEAEEVPQQDPSLQGEKGVAALQVQARVLEVLNPMAQDVRVNLEEILVVELEGHLTVAHPEEGHH